MYKGNVLETLRTSESERHSRFIGHKTEKIKNEFSETKYLFYQERLKMRQFWAWDDTIFSWAIYSYTRGKVALLTQASRCLLSFDLAAYPLLQL